MAKKDDMEKQKLEQEIAELRAKVADQDRVNAEVNRLYSQNLTNEMNAIRRKGNSQANVITITEKPDHRNITLWTRYGKQIGPIHPDNAIRVLQERVGGFDQLSTVQPTAAQIQSFYDSEEGKRFLKIQKDERDRKLKSRKSGQLEKLAGEIATLHGKTIKELNQIKSPGEVGVNV